MVQISFFSSFLLLFLIFAPEEAKGDLRGMEVFSRAATIPEQVGRKLGKRSMSRPKGGSASPKPVGTPSPTPPTTSLSLDPGYCALDIEELRALETLMTTSVDYIELFLIQDRAVEELKAFVTLSRSYLPEEVSMNITDRDLISVVMIQSTPENRLLIEDQDLSAECISVIAGIISDVVSLLLSTITFTPGVAGSLSSFVAKFVQNALKRPRLLSAILRISRLDNLSTLEKAVEILSEVIGAVGVNGFLNAFKEEVKWVDWIIMGASLAATIAALLASGGTFIALIFVSKGISFASLLNNFLGLKEACKDIPPTVMPTTAMPSTAIPTTAMPSSKNPTPEPSMDPPPAPGDMMGNKASRVTSDPHFSAWNSRFSYQGACDLVFIRTHLLELQIRLQFGSPGRTFSFVGSVALNIGDDILEISSNRTFFFNGVQPMSPPTIIGGIFPLNVAPGASSFRISLSGGQMIEITFYSGTITIDVRGHRSDFGTSSGLMGSFDSKALLGRDGLTEYFPANNLSLFANEWAVDPALGDPQLFIEQPTNRTCQDPQAFTPSPSIQQQADVACSGLQDDITRDNCIFDILATGDSGWALNPGFTEPLLPADPQCLSENSDCADVGGLCVWRCDEGTNVCLPNLCSLSSNVSVLEAQVNNTTGNSTVIDGCSCALEPTESPTESPTLSRVALNEVITCISVIDESSGGPSVLAFTSLWNSFRNLYPERPFCLLQPLPNRPSELNIPQVFSDDNNTIFSSVTRDFAVASDASDWFDICNLAGLRSQGIVNVAIFVDNSGSLTTAQVQASYNLLLTRLADNGLTLVAGISNAREDWISPFLVDFL